MVEVLDVFPQCFDRLVQETLIMQTDVIHTVGDICNAKILIEFENILVRKILGRYNHGKGTQDHSLNETYHSFHWMSFS